MSIENILALIGLLFGCAAGIFTVYMNLSGKIDRAYTRLDETKEDLKTILYKELSADKKNFEEHYVRIDLYQQNLKHSGENVKAAMEGFTTIFNAQFNQMKSELSAINNKMEEKSQDIKDLENKIDNLKEFINNKMNNK